MKKLLSTTLFATLLACSSTASADWFNWFDNNNSPWGDDNDWPEWTPMYWMEEMSDEFNDDDDDYYRNYGPRGRYNRYQPNNNYPPRGTMPPSNYRPAPPMSNTQAPTNQAPTNQAAAPSARAPMQNPQRPQFNRAPQRNAPCNTQTGPAFNPMPQQR